MKLTAEQREAVRRLQMEHLTPTSYLKILDTEAYIEGLWRESAECVQVCKDYPDQYNPNEWFPMDQGPNKADHVPMKVRAICNDCEVRLPCLAYAIQTRQENGVWGGRTIKSVRSIRTRLLEALAQMNQTDRGPRQAGSKHN
jgi:WhiB family redox-sensing transcriptional regulator